MSNRSGKFSTTYRQMVSYLRSLANRRRNGIITADDAHNYLNRNGVSRRADTRLSFINSALRSPMFEQAGTTTSQRPAAKGRKISMWTVA
jgi:hypothetical protein